VCPVCVYVSIVLAEQCLLQSTPLCITTEYVLTTIMSGPYCGSFHILLLYLYKEVCMILTSRESYRSEAKCCICL